MIKINILSMKASSVQNEKKIKSLNEESKNYREFIVKFFQNKLSKEDFEKEIFLSDFYKFIDSAAKTASKKALQVLINLDTSDIMTDEELRSKLYNITTTKDKNLINFINSNLPSKDFEKKIKDSIANVSFNFENEIRKPLKDILEKFLDFDLNPTSKENIKKEMDKKLSSIEFIVQISQILKIDIKKENLDSLLKEVYEALSDFFKAKNSREKEFKKIQVHIKIFSLGMIFNKNKKIIESLTENQIIIHYLTSSNFGCFDFGLDNVDKQSIEDKLIEQAKLAISKPEKDINDLLLINMFENGGIMKFMSDLLNEDDPKNFLQISRSEQKIKDAATTRMEQISKECNLYEVFAKNKQIEVNEEKNTLPSPSKNDSGSDKVKLKELFVVFAVFAISGSYIYS